MNETTVTVVGNLVNDPRLRTTESGTEVTHFRIASTARRYDRESNQWINYATVFLAVSCWRALGLNVVASLRKGDPVVVTGRLFSRSYERDGQPRTSYEIDALAVGPDLARGTASFQRTGRPEPSSAAGAGAEAMVVDSAVVDALLAGDAGAPDWSGGEGAAVDGPDQRPGASADGSATGDADLVAA